MMLSVVEAVLLESIIYRRNSVDELGERLKHG